MDQQKSNNDYAEKRDSMRVNVACELYCQRLGVPDVYKITSIDISCSGICFYCEHNFEVGDEAIIHFTSECRMIPEASLMVRIVRRDGRQGDLYKLAATLIFND